MRQFIYRRLPEDYSSDIYIWDVDKTYLNTNFESKRGLLKMFIESSVDKRAIPGAKNLLLELRRGPTKEVGLRPIYFISASPVQLKRILEGKFLIDGIQHDGIILKDYFKLRNRVGKFRVKHNFSYKLVSLLCHRLEMPRSSQEILFGDDFEADAEVYSLYADIVASLVDRQEVKWHLTEQKLSRREMDKILEMIDVVQAIEVSRPVVKKIFINVMKRSSLDSFKVFGPRLIPTWNYLQTAAILYVMGNISKEGFRRIANSNSLRHGLDGWTQMKSLQDLVDRELITEQTFDELAHWK